MNANLVSAVFDDRSEAESAVSELRRAGVSDNAISIVAQQDGKNTTTDGSSAEGASDLIGKAAAGAGIGTLLGIAALAIPGVGPLVAAGAIAASAIPGAAVAGAAIGAAAGSLASVLTKHGVSKDDARYYEDRVNSGGVFVSVDTTETGLPSQTVSDILYDAGGHSSGREKLMSNA